MTVGTICSRVVATASPQETIRAAARRMAEHEVGTLVVLEGSDGKPAGMLTDRDVALRCVAAGLDPDREAVASVMTHPVQTVEEHAAVESAIARMATAGTRRLAVVNDGGRLVGVLSLDDVLDHLARETGAIGRLLAKQQTHVPP